MMKELGNNFTGIDLRCDFPTRESFREALLDHLHAINESGQVTGLFDADPSKANSEIRELADFELEMLAAAGDNASFLEDSLSNEN